MAMTRPFSAIFILPVHVAMVLLLLNSHHGDCSLSAVSPEGCVTVPDMCFKQTSENYTHMRLPNMLNHTRKDDVAADLGLWLPLLQSRECNKRNQLKFFLCLTYAPVCVDNKSTNKFILPCKSMCESVRRSCEPIMRNHNYFWPKVFNCDQADRFFADQTEMCINMNILEGLNNANTRNSRSKFHDLCCVTR